MLLFKKKNKRTFQVSEVMKIDFFSQPLHISVKHPLTPWESVIANLAKWLLFFIWDIPEWFVLKFVLDVLGVDRSFLFGSHSKLRNINISMTSGNSK